MARYACEPTNPDKTVKARGSFLRVSYKNTHETVAAIRGWNVNKALAYLDAVKDHKRAIPFRRHATSTGRTAQGKEFGVTRARWPVKSVEFVEGLIKNAISNAEAKGLDTDSLVITHIQVNQAPKMRRRTYRAHGRINAYQSFPSHIELILEEQFENVPKAKEGAVAAQ
ncbi:hypothetical protein CANCADRAFT_31673, partial [Tortispora caseinolytica NRRL Y-17796]